MYPDPERQLGWRASTQRLMEAFCALRLGLSAGGAGR